MPPLEPLPSSPSFEQSANFLLKEIIEWLETYRPDVPMGTASWRSAFSDIAPEWAQLADWTLELSTQLSVDFLATAHLANPEKGSDLTAALTAAIGEFEREFTKPPSLADRVMRRPGQSRQKDASGRSEKLEEQYRQVREAMEKQSSGLIGVSQLAGLLVDASGLILEHAPAVSMRLLAATPTKSSHPATVFEQRALRRREDAAFLASSSMDQFLPRLERELTQKKAIAQQLQALREQINNKLLDVRSLLSLSVENAYKVLAAQEQAPIAAAAKVNQPSILPRKSGWSLANLVRDSRTPSVSRSTAKALIRLREMENTEVPKGTAAAEYVHDLSRAAGASGVHRAWIPIDGSDSVSSYALATLITHLGGPRGALWSASHKAGLAQNIESWAKGLGDLDVYADKEDLPNEVRAMRGLVNTYQAAYELSGDHPLAVLRLLAKSPAPPHLEMIELTGASDRKKISAGAWARKWLMSPQVAKFRLGECWAPAVERLCIDQTQYGLRHGQVFTKKEELSDFCARLPNPSPSTAAAVLHDLLKSPPGGLTDLFVSALLSWSKVSFASIESGPGLELWEDLCSSIQSVSPSASKSLARWIGSPGRFAHEPTFSKNHPNFNAFLAAGRLFHADPLEAAPSTQLYHVATHAPSLVSDMMHKRYVGLSSGGVCSYKDQVAMWMADMPKFATGEMVKNIIPYEARLWPASGNDAQSQALWDLANKRQDIALCTALSTMPTPPNEKMIEELVVGLQKKGAVSPRQWARWMAASGRSAQTQMYPPQKEEFIEFLAEHLSVSFAPGNITYLSLFDPTEGFAKGAALAAQKAAEDSSAAPAELFVIAARALDKGLAADPVLVHSAHLEAAQLHSLDRMEKLVALALKKMDCSSWGSTPDELSKTWRRVYQEQWEDRLSIAMGDRLQSSPPAQCEVVFEEGCPLPGVSSSRRATCWIYHPRAVADYRLAEIVDKTKMRNLLSTEKGVNHGVHARAFMVIKGKRYTIGVDRGVEIDAETNTKRAIFSWKDRASLAAAMYARDKDYSIEVEALAYQRTETAVLGQDQPSRKYLPGNSTADMVMTGHGELVSGPCNPWSKRSVILGVRPDARPLLPLDMSIVPSDGGELVRHPEFASIHGGNFPERDLGVPAHAEEFFDSLLSTTQEKPSPRPVTKTKTLRAPFR